MSVYKDRKTGRWVAQTTENGRNRRLGMRATKREARELEQQHLALHKGTRRETVGSFTARWVRDYPRPAASTNRHNHERIQRFAREYARRQMGSITIPEARAWTLRHPSELGALRAMFSDARRDEIVRDNPFRELGLKKSRGRRDLPSEWLTEHDIEHLAQKALEVHGPEYGPQFAAMIRFAALTGIRPGELFALTPDCLRGDELEVRQAVESKSNTLKPPKNGRARTVVLVKAAREAAESFAPTSDEWLFATPRGKRLTSTNHRPYWVPVRSAAGRPRMALHELRHYAATRLLELGLSPGDVAVQLGHTDNGSLVMDIYGHPSERAARARILAVVDGFEQGQVAELRARKAADG